MKTLTHAFVLGAATLSWSAAANAAGEVVATPLPAAQIAASSAPNPLGIKPLDSGTLAGKRGGTLTLNDMKLKGVVADNSASHVVTGSNVISEGALSGAAGLPMVIQNSGNNVLIQNATIVNVQLQ
jgi:hypothetical protein